MAPSRGYYGQKWLLGRDQLVSTKFYTLSRGDPVAPSRGYYSQRYCVSYHVGGKLAARAVTEYCLLCFVTAGGSLR